MVVNGSKSKFGSNSLSIRGIKIRVNLQILVLLFLKKYRISPTFEQKPNNFFLIFVQKCCIIDPTLNVLRTNWSYVFARLCLKIYVFFTTF